jgi:putative hydrolase of the HAD superfamily
MSRCIVLDVDDTLYLERDYVRSGFAAVGAWVRDRLGVDGFTETAERLFEEGCRGDVFDRSLLACGCEPSTALVTEMVGIYRHHRPALSLLPDVERFLSRQQHGAVFAVVTDGPVSSQRAKVEALGVLDWANPVVVTAEHGPDFHKPSARPFAMISGTLGVDGSGCVYIADNPLKDFVGPKSLGWSTVRVRRPRGLHYTQPDGSDVDRTVSSFDDIRLF